MEPPDQKVQGGHFELLTVLPEYNWGGCTVFTWRGVAASECEGSLLRVPFQMPLEKGLFLRFSTTVGVDAGSLLPGQGGGGEAEWKGSLLTLNIRIFPECCQTQHLHWHVF